MTFVTLISGSRIDVWTNKREGINMNVLDKIEVISITPLAPGSALRAFATVKLGPLTIHGLRIIWQPQKSPWVSLPQRETQQDGQRKYYPVVEIDNRALRVEIERRVLEAWRRSETGEGSAA
jgi:hypothetical protein